MYFRKKWMKLKLSQPEFPDSGEKKEEKGEKEGRREGREEKKGINQIWHDWAIIPPWHSLTKVE